MTLFLVDIPLHFNDFTFCLSGSVNFSVIFLFGYFFSVSERSLGSLLKPSCASFRTVIVMAVAPKL